MVNERKREGVSEEFACGLHQNPYKPTKRKCKKKGCDTIINGYRNAKRLYYCSLHQAEGFKTSEEKKQIRIEKLASKYRQEMRKKHDKPIPKNENIDSMPNKAKEREVREDVALLY